MARDELEQLSSRELHDRAVRLALRRVDVGFLWSLLEAVPAAEAATGNVDEAERDVVSVARLVNDAVHSGEGDLADALRPLYVNYLAAHEG